MFTLAPLAASLQAFGNVVVRPSLPQNALADRGRDVRATQRIIITMKRAGLFFVLIATLCFASPIAQMSDAQITHLSSEAPVVLVNFWATWCKPCNVEMGTLNRLHQKFPSVLFVGVNVDDVENEGAIPGFLKKHPVGYEIALRRGKDFEAMANIIDPAWKGGIPATFVFLKGKRIFSKTSMIEEAELDQVLDKAVQNSQK
jgi:thiol-disulfide isomerase/thioredoxin